MFVSMFALIQHMQQLNLLVKSYPTNRNGRGDGDNGDKDSSCSTEVEAV